MDDFDFDAFLRDIKTDLDETSAEPEDKPVSAPAVPAAPTTPKQSDARPGRVTQPRKRKGRGVPVVAIVAVVVVLCAAGFFAGRHLFGTTTTTETLVIASDPTEKPDNDEFTGGFSSALNISGEVPRPDTLEETPVQQEPAVDHSRDGAIAMSVLSTRSGLEELLADSEGVSYTVDSYTDGQITIELTIEGMGEICANARIGSVSAKETWDSLVSSLCEMSTTIYNNILLEYGLDDYSAFVRIKNDNEGASIWKLLEIDNGTVVFDKANKIYPQ